MPRRSPRSRVDVLHIGASDLSTEMGIPGQYTHERMRAAFETVAKAARSHGKSMGVGGVRQDFEFQSWLLRLGVRYLTGGSDGRYLLNAGRAHGKEFAQPKATWFPPTASHPFWQPAQVRP